MNLDRMIQLTQDLINARGPTGQEDEVRAVVLPEMKAVCDKVWVDDADNVVGLIRGRAQKKKSAAPVVKVMAHMDELAMTVKRIDENGTLRVRPLGGIRAGVFGLGPVEIMADNGVLPGVLSIGALHTTQESKARSEADTKPIDWPAVHIFTRMSKAQLKEAGVHAGTAVVVAQSRRKLLALNDCIGGYFLDDRVCIAIMLAAASLLKAEKQRPAADVYLVATCQEEIGGGSAAYAAAQLPGAVTMAIDVGPVAAEYDTELNAEPMVVYRDARGIYSKAVADRMVAVGRELGMAPQRATWESYGSDATAAKTAGLTAKAALLCIPTENTHGYEIVQREGIENCARLLAAYLKAPV